MALAVPQSIDDVLAGFDAKPDPFETREVADAIQAARAALRDPSDDQIKGAWAEVLAFNLTPSHGEGSEWGTYFGPIGSGIKADGTLFYSPDIAEADAEILEHWKSRATSLAHPILQARYSDLVWDFARKLAGRGVSSDFAKLAIDAYIAASQDPARQLLYAIKDAQRALWLAISIKDHPRVDGARTGLLARTPPVRAA